MMTSNFASVSYSSTEISKNVAVGSDERKPSWLDELRLTICPNLCTWAASSAAHPKSYRCHSQCQGLSAEAWRILRTCPRWHGTSAAVRLRPSSCGSLHCTDYPNTRHCYQCACSTLQ